MFLNKLFIFVNKNICINYTFISFYLSSQTNTYCKQTFFSFSIITSFLNNSLKRL